jgi:hypothetical protein
MFHADLAAMKTRSDILQSAVQLTSSTRSRERVASSVAVQQSPFLCNLWAAPALGCIPGSVRLALGYQSCGHCCSGDYGVYYCRLVKSGVYTAHYDSLHAERYTAASKKAIPWQALRVPGGWGSQIFRQSAHEGGKVVSPTHQPPLPPRKYSWYSFLLEAESTPGPQCDRTDYVNEKFQWHHRESNPRRSGL